MEDKAVSIESLVKELEKQRLLSEHLNRSSGRPERPRSERNDVRVHVASTSGVKYCFAFQRGACTRPDCPFLHEKDPSKTEVKPKSPSVSRGRPQARLTKEARPSDKPNSKKKGGGQRGASHSRGRSQASAS